MSKSIPCRTCFGRGFLQNKFAEVKPFSGFRDSYRCRKGSGNDMKKDLELLEKMRRNEQGGLEDAIHQYAGYVAAVIRKTLGELGTEEDVEELVSDAFVALWRQAGALRDDSSLKYWLAVVGRNCALKRLGKTVLTQPLEEACFPEEDTPEQASEQGETRRSVREAVARLEPPDNEIFDRFYFREQKISHIAREMGLKEATVKTRLRRGRGKLRRILLKGGAAK